MVSELMVFSGILFCSFDNDTLSMDGDSCFDAESITSGINLGFYRNKQRYKNWWTTVPRRLALASVIFR